MDRTTLPWIHWYNGPHGGIIDKLNIRGYPAIFVLDAEGKIRFKDVRGKELDAAIDALLAKSKTQSAE